MKKIFGLFLAITVLISCKEEIVVSHYKVVLDNKGQMIENDVFFGIINRTRKITGKDVILFSENSRLTLYFEEEFDTNNLKKIILNETLTIQSIEIIEKMTNNLTWQDFQKVEMRVGTILTATGFPEANNPSYILTIDFGEFGIKKSSAQITDLYSTTELIGKQIIAVTNFPIKQIATIQSECLVLGSVGGNKEVTLLSSDIPVENGTKIG